MTEVRRYFALFTALAAVLAANSAIAQSERPQVTVDTGVLAGTLDEAGIRVFKGIPYAAPPVGELRWKEPQPVSAWTGTKDASQFGDRCQQTRFPAYNPIGNRGMSENCLFLNVWSAPGSTRRPVIVWIHGGGFGYGYSNQAAYDGDHFVQKGLVYVNLNYRVGAFGFLAHPWLTQESPNKSSGNYGILDQLAALQWIKRNIDAFGGDPENVTIFGESAGSISVNILTASPLARGLFQRAIGDSGAGLGTTIDTLPVRPLAWEEQRGIKFAGALRVRSVAELRAVPAAEIADVGEHGPGTLFNASRYAPAIDGYLLQESPAKTYAQGAQNNVELIAGWTLHEGTTFMLGSGHGGCRPVWNDAVTSETFVQQANRSFGADTATFLSLYPHSNDSEAKSSAEYVVGDLVITWPTWKWADLQSRSGKTKTYVYLFGKTPPVEAPLHGATHGSEIPYAFNNLQAFKYSWDSMDTKLARTMSAYYANFAKTGNPNEPGLPPWPVYDPSDPQHMVFDENGAAAQLLPLAKLRLIDANQSAGPWCPEVK
jgi:para-nitrobenzyl esterase